MSTSVEREERVAARTTRVDTWLLPLVLFLAIAAVLAVVVQTSYDHLPPEKGEGTSPIADTPFYGGWMQFDSSWYVYIAEHGYDTPQVDAFKAGQQSAVAYFPLYPLTARQVARATDHDFVLAAEITTFLGGLLTVLLFWAWCGQRMSRRARRYALLLMLLYPYAWYLYGSGYGDALFIALTIGAFLLVEKDRPVLAGILGAGASATRFIGVGTIVGLIALTLERRGAIIRTESDVHRRPWSGWRLDRSKLRLRDGGVLLSLSGFLGYVVFLWVRTGDPFAFNTVQAAPGWNQGTGPKTWFKYSFFAEVIKDSPEYWVRLVLQLAVAALCVIALPFVARRIGKSYALYTGIITLIPLIGSSTFQGFGRYLLSAFPVFAVAGLLLAERSPRVDRTRRIILVVSALLLLTQASFFGRGYYLS